MQPCIIFFYLFVDKSWSAVRPAQCFTPRSVKFKRSSPVLYVMCWFVYLCSASSVPELPNQHVCLWVHWHWAGMCCNRKPNTNCSLDEEWRGSHPQWLLPDSGELWQAQFNYSLHVHLKFTICRFKKKSDCISFRIFKGFFNIWCHYLMICLVSSEMFKVQENKNQDRPCYPHCMLENGATSLQLPTCIFWLSCIWLLTTVSSDRVPGQIILTISKHSCELNLSLLMSLSTFTWHLRSLTKTVNLHKTVLLKYI